MYIRVFYLVLPFILACSSPRHVGSVKIAENTGEHYGPAEPSIAVSKVDPSIVVAGSIIDRVHYSTDGGRTFNHTQLTSPLGVFGDPVLWSDHQGRFYYVHLGNPDQNGRGSTRWLESIVINTSSDGGLHWDQGHAIGTNPPKNQDKPWIATNPTTGDLVVTWTEFDKYASTLNEHKSRIRFSKSSDKGQTWSEAITISDQEGDCIDDDDTPEGAVPSIGPHGEIYVVWAFNEQLWFDKSTDGGISWMKQDQSIMKQDSGWTLDVPGLGRANGMPVTGTDLSSGRFKGSLYVCWADMHSGSSDMDVWLMYTRDQGVTWSPRIKVNQDNTGRFQFLPWMSVDPATGFIYVVYYDRRAHADMQTDVVVAYSKNGGQTFKEIKIKGSTFTPPGNKVFFGDYNNISAVQGVVRPIWTSWDGNKLSVWTALINSKRKK